MAVGVDEVRDHPHLRAVSRAILALTLSARSVLSTVTASARAVAHPFEPPGDGDDSAIGDGAGLDGGVGEHVLDVEHQRCPMGELGRPPGEAERERWRHRDDRVGAPEPPAGAQAGEPSQEREPDEPERSARQVATVAAGERVTRVTDPQSVRCTRTSRPVHPGAMAWSRYQGNAVATWTS